MSLTIREAIPADIPALADLHVRTWNATYPDVEKQPTFTIRERQWKEAFRVTDGSWFAFVVEREDGEILGRVVPTAAGWQATTVFGAPLGAVTSREEAVATLHAMGLSSLAEPWWARPVGRPGWQRAHLMEVRPDRVRLRWADPLAEQPASGQWFDIDDLDLSYARPRACRK